MEIYLLKSSACLAILMLFYKLILEPTSAHTFKRFYLLAALLLAFCIPFITFTEYIEPIAIEVSQTTYELPVILETPVEESIDYWPIILWTIYALGVMVCFIKFCYNLSAILSRIRNNPKQKSQGIINVLVERLETPHTFFSYVFLNKHKFEAAEIPVEVLIHEQTHAYQKHSIDVVVLEILQIVFWFNPIMYLLKREVKLNHEYLADRAVLQKGISPSAYQNTLLAFSSKAYHQELANAINYSSIKKRFTVMKKKTSKRNIWLRNLLIIPILALTLYGFSDTKQIEITNINKSAVDEINILIKKDKKVLIDNELILFNSLSDKLTNLTKNNKSKSSVNIHIERSLNSGFLSEIVNMIRISGLDISSISAKSIDLNQNDSQFQSILPLIKNIRFIGDSIFIETESGDKITSSAIQVVSKQLSTSQILPEINSIQTQATAEEVAEYNKLAKHYNNQPDDKHIIKIKDMKRIRQLYDKMSISQRENAEPFPDFPPPPPPPAVPGSKQSKDIKYLPPPPPPPPNATSDQRRNYEKAVSNYKAKKGAYTYKQKNKEGKSVDVVVIPDGDDMAPSPPPSNTKSPLEPITVVGKSHPSQSKIEQVEIIEVVENPDSIELENEIIEIVEVPITYSQDEIKTGFVTIKGEPHYYVTIIDNTRYYNRQGFETNVNGVVVSTSQINASDVVPGQYITKVYSNNKVVAEFKDNRPELKGKFNIPPPPPPPVSPLDHVVNMAKKGAAFYFEGKQISSDKAIQLLKTNKDLNINSKNTGKRYHVYISKDPISD